MQNFNPARYPNPKYYQSEATFLVRVIGVFYSRGLVILFPKLFHLFPNLEKTHTGSWKEF